MHTIQTYLSHTPMHTDTGMHTVLHLHTVSLIAAGGVVAAGQTGQVMQQTDPPCWISVNLAPHTQLSSKPNTGSLHTIPSSPSSSQAAVFF